MGQRLKRRVPVLYLWLLGMLVPGCWKPKARMVKAPKLRCCALRLLMCLLFITTFASSSCLSNCPLQQYHWLHNLDST